MFTIAYFLTNYIFYPLFCLFLFYCFGKPRFIMKIINKVWGIKVTKYEISIFNLLSGIFALGAIINYIERFQNSQILYDLMASHSEGEYCQGIEKQKKLVFKSERGIFLYFTFFLLTVVCVKFADVYEKRFIEEEELERERKKLKQN